MRWLRDDAERCGDSVVSPASLPANGGHVVTCRAPRRNATIDGQQCGGFVADLSGPFVVIGLLKHSGRKRPGSDVASCVVCGALHEYRKNLTKAPQIR